MNRFNFLRALFPVALLCLGGQAVSALTASEVFVNAPHRIFPLIDRTARLDMIDYFKSGLSTRTKNAFNGGSAVTALSPESVNVAMTEASDVQVAVLPCASDSVVALIYTVKTPARDSKLSVYSRDWSKDLTSGVFVKPTLKDWMTEQGRKNSADVEALVPFLLIDYSYNPETSILTLTNNTAEFLSEEVYAIVSPWLQKQLCYKWDGRKFKMTK